MNFTLNEQSDQVFEMEGRYISKFSQNENTNAGSGVIELVKISKNDFYKLLNNLSHYSINRIEFEIEYLRKQLKTRIKRSNL